MSRHATTATERQLPLKTSLGRGIHIDLGRRSNWRLVPLGGDTGKWGVQGLECLPGTEGWNHILRVPALGSDTRKTSSLSGLKTSEANSWAARNLASTCEAWARARLLLN